MPSEPVLYQALEALEVHLKAESEAGRITPPIAQLSESTDFSLLQSFPCVICQAGAEAAYEQHDPNLMTAILTIRACIIEERPESVQREMIHFVHELRKAINRQTRYAGAQIIYRRATYKQLTKTGGNGPEVMHYTDIEFEVNYRERATER